MAGAVISVEHFTFNLAATERVDDTANVGETSLSQDLDNCVPFITRRVTSGTDKNIENYQFDAYFDTTPDRVVVERDDTAESVVVEVALVEFDPARVNVYGGGTAGTIGQQGAVGSEGKWYHASGGGLSQTVDLSSYPGGSISVDLSKTFLVFHSFQNSGATDNYDTHLFRGRITGTQEITFDRTNAGGSADGHWWLVESSSGDFTVEATDIQILDTASSSADTVTLASADLDNSFLIGSWKGEDAGGVTEDYNSIYTLDVVLTENTVTASRSSTTDQIDWSGFVVKTTDGTTVQRGTISGQSATTSDPQTINSVEVDMAMPIFPGNMGSTCGGGSFTGTAGSDVPDAQVALSFSGSPTSTTLDVKHSTAGSESGQDISWEVVEWGTGGAAAARRVMVIS